MLPQAICEDGIRKFSGSIVLFAFARYGIRSKKLSKDGNVSMDVIEKICSVLSCDVGDITEFIPDKKGEQ